LIKIDQELLRWLEANIAVALKTPDIKDDLLAFIKSLPLGQREI
jgi:hypothetical protein